MKGMDYTFKYIDRNKEFIIKITKDINAIEHLKKAIIVADTMNKCFKKWIKLFLRIIQRLWTLVTLNKYEIQTKKFRLHNTKNNNKIMINRQYYDRFIEIVTDYLLNNDFNNLEVKFIDNRFILVRVDDAMQFFEANDTVNALNFIINNC